MLAIISGLFTGLFISHLYVVISLISSVLYLQPLPSVVPMNSSFSFLKTSDSFLKGRLDGKSLGLEVRDKVGA